MKLERHHNLETFRAETLALLCRRETENNLFLGMLHSMAVGLAASTGPTPHYMALIRDGGVPSGAALVPAPNRPLITTRMTQTERTLIADDVAKLSPWPIGVVGEKDNAMAFGDLFSNRTSTTTRVAMELGVFKLERLRLPRPSPGLLRLATADDAALLCEWTGAFTTEASVLDASPDPRPGVNRAIAEGRFYVWEDEGRPVTMAVAAGPTPHGIRVTSIYTPPELRRRGYATNCVARVTEIQLKQGRTFCFLFTDLGNQTSNAIYRRIGYEHVCDFLNLRFES